MILNYLMIFVSLICYSSVDMSFQDESGILFREDFVDLKNWDEFNFAGNKKPTDYITESDSNLSYLMAVSNSSASGLIYKDRFDLNQYPVIRWRWKVENIIKNADGKTKDGDDYAIRLYVMFKDDSAEVSFWDSIKNTAINIIYGFDPPDQSLCFVWANKDSQGNYYYSPYSKKVITVPVNWGNQELGDWITHQIDVAQFYYRVLDKRCPKEASIAIMSDTDNTGGMATAYLDYIEVGKK